MMADTESLGEAGVRWLEGLGAIVDGQRQVRIPTITDPRGTDFAKADMLGQTSTMLDLERRAIAAFVKLGVAMTDTCINYQTIQAPTRNEHVAFGDTGVVIYSNSICGARSNFEGGPSALAAGTNRTNSALRISSPEDAPGHVTHPAGIYPHFAQRLGCARRRNRPQRRQLLGGTCHRRHRGHAALGPAETFRRLDGEFRLHRAVSSGRALRRKPSKRPTSPTPICRAFALPGPTSMTAKILSHRRYRRRRGVLGAAAQPV